MVWMISNWNALQQYAHHVLALGYGIETNKPINNNMDSRDCVNLFLLIQSFTIVHSSLGDS